MGRTAVVIVHGMGQQKPMESLRSFSSNFKNESKHMFSSPNRIIGDLETRRISFLNQKYDYYEFYWAHLVDSISLSKVLIWGASLLFYKNRSKRYRQIWIKVYIMLAIFVVAGGAIIYGIYRLLEYFNSFNEINNLFISSILAYFIYRLIVPFLSKYFSDGVVHSLGDVVKYTIPNPQNVGVRNQIRKKGMGLLMNLHNAERSDGNPQYERIILVGHSLGSIICYDLLTHLFPQFQHTYDAEKIVNSEEAKMQSSLNRLEMIAEKSDFDLNEFQNAQNQLLKEFQALGFKWRITDFITLGSPLTHSEMIFTDFNLKKALREYPTCPPQKDPTDKSYFYLIKKIGFRVPNHAAFFAFTKWTNIYFENDWIGGNLQNVFGKGIKEHKHSAESNWTSRHFPFASHVKYWNPEEKNSIKKINEILQNK